MYRPQQAFAFDQERGYAETGTDSLPAHGKKNTGVSGDTILTLPCVWRHMVPDLAFYHFSIYHLRLFNREYFTLVLDILK